MNICLTCGKNTNNNKFCSRSCASTYNNKLRKSVSWETIQKRSNSLKKYYKNKGHKIYICKKCKTEYKYIQGQNTKIFCSKECSNYYKKHRNEFLSKESIEKISNGGKKSAIVQGDARRSKNEKYFYELCYKEFSNVLHNECMFNNWDADIILPEFKIAVLWNGAWHYKQIKKNTSLKQIQNRDSIKIKEIESCGYTTYIIKDLGKYNKSFVETEFEKFKKYIAGC